jgi:peptidyl-prolyl cis-trans isomerase A (cyclophilin A)
MIPAMMPCRRAPASLLLLCLLPGCGDAQPDPIAKANSSAEAGNSAEARAPEPLPDTVRVKLETEAGAILLALDAKRAPITTANFVRYAEEGRLDGTTFYRAARTKGEAGGGFIQGGIRRSYKRMLPPIEHEPTALTGLMHEAGTISMARAEEGAGSTGDFFITLSRQRAMDAGQAKPGYAAFGKVVEGMDVVRKILAAPTVPNAGRGAMRGQMIEKPVRIVSARRVD